MRIIYLVKEIRIRQQMTLKELSIKTGISKSHINDIENNIKEPSNSILVRLAKALKVGIIDLYKVIN